MVSDGPLDMTVVEPKAGKRLLEADFTERGDVTEEGVVEDIRGWSVGTVAIEEEAESPVRVKSAVVGGYIDDGSGSAAVFVAGAICRFHGMEFTGERGRDAIVDGTEYDGAGAYSAAGVVA